MEDTYQNFIEEILLRSRNDPNTFRYYQLTKGLMERIKQQTYIDLFSIPEKLAKTIVATIKFTEELKKEVLGLLNLYFIQQDIIAQKDKFIGEQYDKICGLEKENHLLGESELAKENAELRKRNKYLEQEYIAKDEACDMWSGLAHQYMIKYNIATGTIKSGADIDVTDLITKHNIRTLC